MILLSEGIYNSGIARFTKCVKLKMLAIKPMGCKFCCGTVLLVHYLKRQMMSDILIRLIKIF